MCVIKTIKRYIDYLFPRRNHDVKLILIDLWTWLYMKELISQFIIIIVCDQL